jgi:hypothetical protein
MKWLNHKNKGRTLGISTDNLPRICPFCYRCTSSMRIQCNQEDSLPSVECPSCNTLWVADDYGPVFIQDRTHPIRGSV